MTKIKSVDIIRDCVNIIERSVNITIKSVNIIENSVSIIIESVDIAHGVTFDRIKVSILSLLCHY